MPLPTTIVAITVAGQGALTWAIPLGVFLAVLFWYMVQLIRRFPSEEQPSIRSGSMRQRRIARRGAALVIVAALGLGIGAGVLIHSQQAGHAASARDNPPGLHGQATWEPGERPAPDFQLADQGGRPVSLASLRGSPVMLAFLSSRCRLGCARKVQTLRHRARAAAIGGSARAGHREPGSG